MSNLERAALIRKNVVLEAQPTALDARFPRFDPTAMTTAYRDEKLKLNLPALWAFDLESDTVEREIGILDEDITFTRDWEDETVLNLHSVPLWEALSKTKTRNTQKNEAVGQLTMCLVVSSVLAFCVDTQFSFSPKTDALIFLLAIGLFIATLFTGSIFLRTYAKRGMIFRVAFEGLIPDRVRRNIERNRQHFSSILLVCDVTNSWGLKFANPVNLDPLVVGAVAVKGKKTLYYLIDQFDLTPIEDHTAAEWTARAS